jgi:Sec-independent protein secretion pathway component TatC
MLPLTPDWRLLDPALLTLFAQGEGFGLRLIGSGPGRNLLWVNTALLVGLMLVLPLLVCEVLLAVRPSVLARRPVAAALAILALWVAFLIGDVVGYALLIPATWPWIAGTSAQGTDGIAHGTDGPAIILSAPVYLYRATNMLLWSGLLFLLPAVLYVLATIDRWPPIASRSRTPIPAR